MNPLASLPDNLRNPNRATFKGPLKRELEGFRDDVLPLREVVGEGAEIVSCHSCGEGDPIGGAYCELAVSIDKVRDAAAFALIP